MFNSKKIKELEARISALEGLFSTFSAAKPQVSLDKSTETSYEEVIDQWLNGKRS